MGLANEGEQSAVQNPLLVNRNQNVDEVLLNVQRINYLEGKTFKIRVKITFIC